MRQSTRIYKGETVLSAEGHPDILIRKGQGFHAMSFVGIVMSRSGVFGFADSKSSVDYGVGGLAPDQNRAFVRKVFRGKDYILCAYGANGFLHADSNEAVYLEDWIPEHLSGTAAELLSLLSDNISQNRQNLPRSYDFFIGGKDRMGYYVRSAEISGGVLSFSQKDHAPNNGDILITAGGADYYVSRAQMIRWQLEQYPVSLWKEKIITIIQDMVQAGDGFGVYNSVGGDICVEVIS